MCESPVLLFGPLLIQREVFVYIFGDQSRMESNKRTLFLSTYRGWTRTPVSCARALVASAMAVVVLLAVCSRRIDIIQCITLPIYVFRVRAPRWVIFLVIFAVTCPVPLRGPRPRSIPPCDARMYRPTISAAKKPKF